MNLQGQVETIIFRNEQNGYTIANVSINEFESDDEELNRRIKKNGNLTLVGYLPFVNKGDNLKAIGKMVVHPEYGEQFKVEIFEKVMPETLEGLKKYLGSGIIKGVGPSTAKKIVDKFGKNTINVLKSQPEMLALIKGITTDKAISISESFIESYELWQIVGFLEKFGIGSSSAQSVFKSLGKDAITKIQNDPYVLEEIGIKCDFSQIDKIALSIGIERTSLRRMEMGLIHGLKLASYNGHSCVLEEALLKFTSGLLGVDENELNIAIKDLTSKEKVNVEKRTELLTLDGKTEEVERKWIYLNDFYLAESNIAYRIKELSIARNNKKVYDIDKMIKEVSKIKPSEKQKEAIKMINENNVSIITGGPGTGKTTIIRTIIDIYKSIGKKVILCAPTGRAAKRMTEATGEDAKTLHRLLEIGKIEDEKFHPDMDVTPIDADIIIVDEVSMVDMFLMNYLLNGIYKGTKLILVGDINQLPSVGPGRVLKDLIDSNKIPYIQLNKIFRQAAKSKIIVNAHKVNDGINFIGEVNDDDTLDDFEFIAENNPKIIQEMILEQYTDKNIQVITPTKRGDLGTKNLNKLIQEKYNPKDKIKREKHFGDVIFREGDKVMQTKNNYDIEWVKNNSYDSNFELSINREFGSGIFNGEMGTIIDIDNDTDVMEIRFEDGKIADYSFQDLDQIEHSYAITVHKSQGSEFDTVLMPILGVSQMLLTRNILYTGMTRAKKMLYIYSNESTIEFMINNNHSKERNSGLKYKLIKIFSK